MPSGRVIGGSVAAALLVAASAGCGADRRALAVTEARLVAPDTVELVVGSCDGDPEITQLVAGDRQVQVEVSATVSEPGDCSDVVELGLDAPLGGRELIDLAAGAAVTVAGRAG